MHNILNAVKTQKHLIDDVKGGIYEQKLVSVPLFTNLSAVSDVFY